MMTTARFTLSEAGYLLGRSARTINKAVDSGLVRARLRRRGGRKIRTLGTPELRFLRLVDQLKGDLTPTGRRKLYEAVRKLSLDVRRVEVGPLVVDLTETDREIERRLARLERVKALVELDEAGEPVIRDVGVPVYALAALVEGESVEEVLEDYPRLTREQVEAAAEYTIAYPKRGRPYPRRSLKRMLADLDFPSENTLSEVRAAGAGPRLIET